MNVIGYVRCSTGEQAQSGLGLDAQRTALEAIAAQRGWDLELREEAGASAKSMDRRPILQEALRDLKTRRAHGLAVARLDRLNRSVADFARLLQRAQREEWSLIVLDTDVDTTAASGRLVAHILAATAEHERELISARTREALAAARASGTQLGRPSNTPQAIVDRVVRERTSGATWQSIADRLNQDRVPTVRGGACWRVSTVQRVAESAAAHRAR